MTEREKIIQLARECNVQSLKEPRYHMDIYELTGQAIEALYHKAQREAFEQAAKVADANCEDEPYGHAKFRCVNIADEIRQLIKE